MNPVLLDTGYLLALELANDENHQAAWEHWQEVLRSPPPLVTTSSIFSEVVTFFNTRGYHAKAVEVGNSLLRSPSVQLIHVDETLFHAGWAYLQQHQDKEYSLTDCISFALMQRLGIRTAFSFDRHFAQAGFQKLP
jgi:predicted nucleic acid-binding protein